MIGPTTSVDDDSKLEAKGKKEQGENFWESFKMLLIWHFHRNILLF